MCSLKSKIISRKATTRSEVVFGSNGASGQPNVTRPAPGYRSGTASQEATTSGALQVVKTNGVWTIFLNRPEVLNAIDLEMAQTLREQLQLAATDPAVRVVVLTGKGRAFCAGGDLKFALQANPQQPGDSFQALTSLLHDCIEQISTMPKSVVAVINGPAAGAGLFLALACDLRVMAESAYLKLSNTTYGLSLPAGGTFFLPRLIGTARALELAILDDPITTPQAYAMGLVTSVVPDAGLQAKAEVLVGKIMKRAVHSIGQVKQLYQSSFSHSLREQLDIEQAAIVTCVNHAEGREGLDAFVQKRIPDFE